ncbi:Lipoprotein lipase, partial [Folsomia candida]
LLLVLIVATVAIFVSCLEWDTSSQEPPSRPFEPTRFHYFLCDQPNLDLTREQVLNKSGKQLTTAYFYIMNVNTIVFTFMFYIHGFDSESLEKAESYKVKDAIFKAHQNTDLVVVVDWSKESSRGQFQYPIVVKYTVPAVALNVSLEILWISSNLGIPPNQIKMAGHSLGAHVMGIAGERTVTKRWK